MGTEANKANAIAVMTEFSSGDRVAAWKRATGDVTWTMNQHAIPGGERITFNRAAYDAMVDSSGDLFPQGIKMTFDPKATILTISGIDRDVVGNLAAQIKRVKPPEPYKGTGIKYQGEHIIRKAGKTAAGASSGGAGAAKK